MTHILILFTLQVNGCVCIYVLSWTKTPHFQKIILLQPMAKRSFVLINATYGCINLCCKIHLPGFLYIIIVLVVYEL